MKELLLISIFCSFLIFFYVLFFVKSDKIFFISIYLTVIFLFLTEFYLIVDKFTGDGVTEAVFFHISYGLDGVPLGGFITQIMLATLLAIANFLLIPISKKWYFHEKRKQFLSTQSSIVEIILVLSLGIFAVGAHPTTLQSISIFSDFLKSADNDIFNAALQQKLPIIDLERKQRSLVYIYAESLERTFLSESNFPKLTPHINLLEKTSLSFYGIGQPPLTNWTVAGMVASQCGVPLATFRANRNDLTEKSDLVAGSACLGDLLKENNYNLSYMGGADIGFAGKGNFYKSHGFSDVVGLQDFQEQFGKDIPLSEWGVYDDMLLDNALEKFKRLSSRNEPFALVVLTLDTHPSSGHITPRCASDSMKYGDGKNKMLNAVKCADFLISDFIKKLEAENKHDAIIVLASDHLQIESDAIDLLNTASVPRRNLLMVRGNGVPIKVIERTATPLDISPTILSLLGWDAKNLALGKNLLLPEKNFVEELGEAEFFENLKHWRLTLWKTWDKQNSQLNPK